jgi:hypothetical protein
VECDPLLPPAISVITTASEEHEHHNDNQKSCHSLLPIHIEDLRFCMWVRTDYVASHGIYLVVKVRRPFKRWVLGQARRQFRGLFVNSTLFGSFRHARSSALGAARHSVAAEPVHRPKPYQRMRI